MADHAGSTIRGQLNRNNQKQSKPKKTGRSTCKMENTQGRVQKTLAAGPGAVQKDRQGITADDTVCSDTVTNGQQKKVNESHTGDFLNKGNYASQAVSYNESKSRLATVSSAKTVAENSVHVQHPRSAKTEGQYQQDKVTHGTENQTNLLPRENIKLNESDDAVQDLIEGLVNLDLSSFEEGNTDNTRGTSYEESNDEIPGNVLDISEQILQARQNTNDVIKQLRRSFPQQVCRKIEKDTQEQRDCASWFHHRKGRITASNFHSVYTRINTKHQRSNEKTDLTNTLKLILYPVRIKTVAMKWGIDHEDTAVAAYTMEMSKTHQEFSTSNCGLFIFEEYPFLAATPDRLVSCKCCGLGVLEVKCPWKARDKDPRKKRNRSLFSFFDQNSGCLKQRHSYYSQVMGQMAATGRDWVDFCVWTLQGMYIERIPFNKNYWNFQVLPNLIEFFKDHMVQEIKTKRTYSHLNAGKRNNI